VSSIVFSGPAKSIADLERASAHADRVLVQMDSIGELARLGEVTRRTGRRVRAGVRVATAHHGAWSKFGIPLDELPPFVRAAREHPGIQLCALQAHLSWNRSPDPYRRVIEAIGATLEQLTADERAAIEIVDLGGGYRPHRLEGSYPIDHPLHALLAIGADHEGAELEHAQPFFVKESVPLEDYARTIGEAIRAHLAPHLRATYFTEPGRIVSTYAMHIVTRVVDKKSDALVIVDGGIHMVGWEKYLQIYAPVVDLTHPAEDEIEVRLGGSLCDSEDVLGLRVFASAVEEGDVLVIPFQGAYSFSVAQSFIRSIPDVHALPEVP
jgi:diaminopimelate decarboxylase